MTRKGTFAGTLPPKNSKAMAGSYGPGRWDHVSLSSLVDVGFVGARCSVVTGCHLLPEFPFPENLPKWSAPAAGTSSCSRQSQGTSEPQPRALRSDNGAMAVQLPNLRAAVLRCAGRTKQLEMLRKAAGRSSSVDDALRIGEWIADVEDGRELRPLERPAAPRGPPIGASDLKRFANRFVAIHFRGDDENRVLAARLDDVFDTHRGVRINVSQ